MADFIKLNISYLGSKVLLDNPLLHFEGEWEQSTGLIRNFPLRASYYNLEFIIKSENFIILQGSLHKYWNAINTGLAQNYNDFCYNDVISSIRDLCSKFGIDPTKSLINNLEFGINLVLPFDPDRILKRIINYKGYPITRIWEREKHIIECVRQRYIIKAYNKGLQYNQQEYIFRFELKAMRMAHVPDIRTLADITSSKLSALSEMLVKNWNELLISEDLEIPADLSEFDKTLLYEGVNANYWLQLRDNKPGNYFKRLEKFRELNKRYSKDHLQEFVGEMIMSKLTLLLKESESSLQKLTDFTIHHEGGANEPQIPVFNSSGILLISEPGSNISRRYCKTCGRDITDQKPGSFYCSEKLYGKEVKRCRNLATNPRNNLRRRIEKGKSGQFLFDIQEQLILTPYQKELLGITPY